MNTRELTSVLPTLFAELVFGSPDPTVGTNMLNRGDPGLLASLDRLSASDASTSLSQGGSIAAHVDHLRYGLSLLNRWVAGESAPWKDADWTMSWRKPVVSDTEWRALREAMGREADAWLAALRAPRHLDDRALGWVIDTL